MFTTDAHCDTLYRIAIENASPESLCVTPERLRACLLYTSRCV